MLLYCKSLTIELLHCSKEYGTCQSSQRVHARFDNAQRCALRSLLIDPPTLTLTASPLYVFFWTAFLPVSSGVKVRRTSQFVAFKNGSKKAVFADPFCGQLNQLSCRYVIHNVRKKCGTSKFVTRVTLKIMDQEFH